MSPRACIFIKVCGKELKIESKNRMKRFLVEFIDVIENDPRVIFAPHSAITLSGCVLGASHPSVGGRSQSRSARDGALLWQRRWTGRRL